MFFKFELNSSSPYFNCRVQQQIPNNGETSVKENNENQNNKAFNYYITVINNIDSFNENYIKNFNAIDVDDTFLFIIKHKEKQYENSGIEQRVQEIKDCLTSSLSSTFHDAKPKYIDLMLSTKLQQPFYTTTLDFSVREKLELYRLPQGAENLTHPDSPYLIFRTNDHGLSRIFVRSSLKNVSSIITIQDRFSQIDESTLLQNKIFELLDGACGEIRVSCAADKSRSTFDCNHVFIRLEYDTEIGKRKTDYWPRSIEEAIKRCEKYLIKHRITEVEVNYEQLRPSNNSTNEITESQQFETIRIVYMNETGAIPEICVYRINEDRRLIPIESGGHARLAGKSSATPHHTIQQVNVQKKRYQANKLGTTYVYDMPIMFGKAAFDEWTFFKRSDPKSYSAAFDMLPSEQQLAINNSDVRKLAKVFEMVLTSDDPNSQLCIIRSEEELNRRMSSGCNDRGMIAWEMQIWTPDSPHGRSIVLISNDITFQMGSFSMREHRLYQKASEYSRTNKMPRVYIAANSGARIGFASDIKNHLNIVWNDDDRPEDGFRYLTLDSKIENSEILSQIESTLLNNGNRRIDAIIGKEGDIGVENLVGSGLIAAETSAAYRKVPTYCLVSGRAVGIGAYVARLSHRICQVENSHIILTGAAALNSVLGREVYTSNNQLGGPQIMYHNGVTHSVAHDDMDGIKKILHWITYLPPSSSLPSPTIFNNNSVEENNQQKDSVNIPLCMLKDDKARMVHTQPTKSAYDPRLMLDPPDGGGLFDKGTFDEIMSGWAKTIIAGRARLRGLAVGVLAVETRTVECEIPADPATQDSQAKCVLQAGQVWHTDSAFKTAEAINDFNHEGLPLIILANIRGFSGGQKDMFEMVLKFGAWIVDALQTYTQPVIIYLPPFGELRGGAWAVLDTQINPTCITMLADSNSRGGVLEANGIVEIKFREKDLSVLLKKCDEKTAKLEEELISFKNNKIENNQQKKKELQQEYEKRKEKLLPVCRAAAVRFADLHDTTARMIAKGAIHDEVAWQNTRNYFYNLLCVQSIKMQMAKSYLAACSINSLTTTSNLSYSIDDLEKGCKWVDEHLANYKIQIRRQVNPKDKPSMDFSKRTRFIYFFEQIMEYANGKEFQHVLEQIKADSLLKQLKLVTGNKEQRERFVAALLERD